MVFCCRPAQARSCAVLRSRIATRIVAADGMPVVPAFPRNPHARELAPLSLRSTSRRTRRLVPRTTRLALPPVVRRRGKWNHPSLSIPAELIRPPTCGNIRRSRRRRYLRSDRSIRAPSSRWAIWFAENPAYWCEGSTRQPEVQREEWNPRSRNIVRTALPSAWPSHRAGLHERSFGVPFYQHSQVSLRTCQPLIEALIGSSDSAPIQTVLLALQVLGREGLRVRQHVFLGQIPFADDCYLYDGFFVWLHSNLVVRCFFSQRMRSR